MGKVRKFRLKTPAKVLLFVILVLGILGGVFAAYDAGLIKTDSSKKVSVDEKEDEKSPENKNDKTSVKDDNSIDISLDEWIGWKSILDANGGLTTKDGSIFDKLGIDVNISIINDASQSSNAIIKGDLDGAGYTINRYAFLYDKFKSNNVAVQMPFITNFSTGGDGIISKEGINNVEDLVGKKIGVPRFSEAQTLVIWLLNQSNLTKDQQKEIIDNLIMFETPDDAANAFFGGQLDVAATWQPYLSQAQETTGCKLLFSTKSATNLILDGIVFNKAFLDKNPQLVEKFIEGTLMAADMYSTEFGPIKNSMGLFATETNENIAAMTKDGELASYLDNVELLGNLAPQMFEDMSNIWSSIGEKSHANLSKEAFNSDILKRLEGKFEEVQTNTPMFTEDQRVQAQAVDNTEALLKKSVTINFTPNSATFLNPEEAGKILDDFVKISQVLNGSIIQIEGNIADTGEGDNEAGRALSLQRAKTVAQYFKSKGVDPSRFIVVGNGIANQVASNDTENGKAQNRRTDVFFKIVE